MSKHTKGVTSSEVDEAYARLMEAAPEMLELLIDLYEHGYTTSHDHDRVAAMITRITGEDV